jgi:DnaJ-class molecular chaperone
MRLPGHGLPHMDGKGQGDLYVRIHIPMPDQLSKKQKALIEKLADAGL